MKHSLMKSFLHVLMLVVTVLATQLSYAQPQTLEGLTPKPTLTFLPRAEIALIGSSLKADVSISGPNGSYTVRATGPGTTDSVELSIPGNTSGTVSLSIPSTPGDANYKAVIVDTDVEKTKTVTAVKVEVANPTGNPADPATASEGKNEFTFDPSNPGVLRIPCQATLTPATDATREWAESNVSWEVTDVSGSTKSWEGTGNDNKGASATCVFTGLPKSNGDFGEKTVTMTAGDTPTPRPIEVFFPRDATNHPEGDQTPTGSSSSRSPNWFYYWNPVVGDPSALYEDGIVNAFALVPAMRHWSRILPYSKTEIWVGNSIVTQPAWWQNITGMDLFADTIKHEKGHVTQIAQADATLGAWNNKPYTVWRSGWSWNAYDNRWSLGPDGATGIRGIDDDGNGRTDDLLDTEEFGSVGSDDADLDINGPIPNDLIPNAYKSVWIHASWPTVTGAPQPLHGIEYWCMGLMTTNEDDNWEIDWSNGGKRYGTNSP